MRTIPRTESYRPDIDGLRAVAVILVVLFHYQFAFFPGGFIGVDVFFVISGFLISGVIENALDKGGFSLKEFLFRRARRLLPGYLVTISASAVAACFIFIPEHLKTTALHVPAAIFYVSNFLFIGEIDYFGVSALFSPLIHTWSLSVEGQFYAIWLIVLLSAHRYPALRKPSLIILFCLSIFGAIAFSNFASSYYFTPFRIYEFMFGYFVFLLPTLSPSSRRWLEPIFLFIGLFAIFHASVAFNDQTPFPSLYAAYPCAGAAFVMIGGNCAAGRWIIGNRLMAYLGRLSYLVFLVHWPLFVFYHYGSWGEVNPTAKATLIGVSFALSVLLYHFVEQPFRRHLSFASGRIQYSSPLMRYATVSTGIAVLLCLPLAAAFIWHKSNAGWQYDAAWSREIQSEKQQALKLRNEYLQANNKPPAAGMGVVKRVLVIGDSHGHDVFNALHLNADRFPGYVFHWILVPTACYDSTPFQQSAGLEALSVTASGNLDCVTLRQNLLDSRYAASADILLMANRWRDGYLGYFEGGVKFLRRHLPGRIVVWGVNDLPFDIVTLTIARGTKSGLNEVVYGQDRSRFLALDRTMAGMAGQLGVEYFSFLPTLCDDVHRKCAIVNEDRELLYFDSDHWTFAGQRHFGRIVPKSLFEK